MVQPTAPQVAASILNADFSRLDRVVHKMERAGADRLHLDVMDGHFVDNLTFGADIVAAFRRLTTLPLDVHLMITEPARYIERFIVTSWADYLHQRARATMADQALEARARDFVVEGEKVTMQHYIAER